MVGFVTLIWELVKIFAGIAVLALIVAFVVSMIIVFIDVLDIFKK